MVKTPDPVEHAGSLADEKTIRRDADVGEFDADTRQGLSEAQASEFLQSRASSPGQISSGKAIVTARCR